jgi:RalA-binding protein 1
VADFVDPQERIRELSHLIAALPIANYTLLRALTAHLILIVQNSGVNKMTMRNVGIVFSPTLGIPAGVFSLMLGEFNRVFNVDADRDEIDSHGDDDGPSELHPRNSRQYSDTAADQLLGLGGRTLKSLYHFDRSEVLTHASLPAPAEETQSEGDDFSLQEESGTETTEGDFTMESSSESITSYVSQPSEPPIRITPPDTPVASKMSKASNAAATRGLNVSISPIDRSSRQSRMTGLPSSPRPLVSPVRSPDIVSSPTFSRSN